MSFGTTKIPRRLERHLGIVYWIGSMTSTNTQLNNTTHFVIELPPIDLAAIPARRTKRGSAAIVLSPAL
jgi:hypothetical protein